MIDHRDRDLSQEREERPREVRVKEMQIFARDEYYHGRAREHCRLAGCRRPRRIRSVSFESARCVWLTSRPSWPLEGGRPPGGPPITRPVSATRTRPRSVIPSSTFERRSCTTPGEPSRAKPSQARRGRARVHHRKSAEGPQPRVPTAGDRIMFRYLYDARSTFRAASFQPPMKSSERPRRGETAPFDVMARLTLCHYDRATTRLNRRLHSGAW